MYPEELKYTERHEWAAPAGSDAPATVRIGITAYAQDALGDIVFVTLPAEGTAVEAGQTVGEIESTKSVSDLYAPVSGTIVATNGALENRPELINSDPYGEGWIVEISVSDPSQVDGLLDAASYSKHVTES